jgi:hypothetical protein
MERVIWLPIAIVAAMIVGFGIGVNVGRATDKTTTIIYHHEQPTTDARKLDQFGIRSNAENCQRFGIPVDACPEEGP